MKIEIYGLIFTFIFSLIAVAVSIASWYKSRAIYDIEKYKFPKRVGDSKTTEDLNHEKILKKKLKTGVWQILHMYDKGNDELMIVIGKTKK